MNILRQNELWLALLVALLAHFIALPFAQSVDADSVSRTFGALYWVQDPYWITEGIWAPFHAYLCGAWIWLTDDHVTSLKVLHVLFAVATAIPIYKFSAKFVSPGSAIVPTLIYLFAPVVFRNSYHVLSGIPCGFFIAWGMYHVLSAIQGAAIRNALLAGLFMTVASGLRYEAWLLMALFGVIMLLHGKWRMFLLYCSTAGIFPLIWMFGNYLAHGDLFYGLSGSDHWNLDLEGTNDRLTEERIISRYLFLPYSLLLNLTPFVLFPFLALGAMRLAKGRFQWSKLVWLTPFLIILPIFVVKCINGTFITHHRYTIILILLICPYTAMLVLGRHQIIRWSYTLIAIGLMVPLSWYWSSVRFEHFPFVSGDLEKALWTLREETGHTTEAVPRLRSQNAPGIVEKVNKARVEGEGLMVDFFNWEDMAYITLHSGLKPMQVFVAPGGGNERLTPEILIEYIDRGYPKGLVAWKTGAKFDLLFGNASGPLVLNETKSLSLERLMDLGEDGVLYRYHLEQKGGSQ